MAKKNSIGSIKILLKETTEKAARQLVLDIHENLVRDTPILSGWARINWLLSVGHSIEEVSGSKDSINPAQQMAGVASILTWEFSQGPAYDTNNVPYIRPLNEGHSRQQSQPGFVERAVQSGVEKANRKRLE
jgi:hypothetical protein